jgi:hypothetical protein
MSEPTTGHDADQADAELPPADLISTSEACKILPSSLPGRKYNICSLYRLMQNGRLRFWRVAGSRRRFVSKGDVLDLIQPGRPAGQQQLPSPPSRRERQERRRVAAQSEEILRRAGI